MDSLDGSKDCEQDGSVGELFSRLRDIVSKLPPERADLLLEGLEMAKKKSAGPELDTDLESALRTAITESGLTHYAIAKQITEARGGAPKFGPDILDRFIKGERTITLGNASEIAKVLNYVLVKNPD